MRRPAHDNSRCARRNVSLGDPQGPARFAPSARSKVFTRMALQGVPVGVSAFTLLTVFVSAPLLCPYTVEVVLQREPLQTDIRCPA